MQTIIGWLFGMRAKPDAHISVSNVTIRKMSDEEKSRIVRSCMDFFAKDQQIWVNCTSKFPLVFEKKVPDECPIGGNDSVAVLLSLLSLGEVRTPVAWSLNEGGGGGGASDSQIIDCFYRSINGRFQPVEFDVVRQSAVKLFEYLEFFVSSSPHEHLDAVLLDRLFESKEHILKEDAPDSDVIARAADICIGFELLYAEGGGEIQFKLAISMAWLLEPDPLKRQNVMTAIRNTYGLRSKIVHGGNATHKPLKKELVESVICADRLLRRSILAQLLNKIDGTRWKEAFTKARLGLPIQIDTAEWVQS